MQCARRRPVPMAAMVWVMEKIAGGDVAHGKQRRQQVHAAAQPGLGLGSGIADRAAITGLLSGSDALASVRAAPAPMRTQAWPPARSRRP